MAGTTNPTGVKASVLNIALNGQLSNQNLIEIPWSVGISGGCASMRNAPLSPESRYIPYFLLFSFILQAVGPILSFSPFIL